MGFFKKTKEEALELAVGHELLAVSILIAPEKNSN